MLFRHVILLVHIPLQSRKDLSSLRQRLPTPSLQRPQFSVPLTRRRIRLGKSTWFGD